MNIVYLLSSVVALVAVESHYLIQYKGGAAYDNHYIINILCYPNKTYLLW